MTSESFRVAYTRPKSNHVRATGCWIEQQGSESLSYVKRRVDLIDRQSSLRNWGKLHQNPDESPAK